MEVILREDIENLGLAYDVVDVKPGYARNYLIPGGKAVLATEKEKGNLQTILDNLAKEQAAEIKSAQELADKINNTEVKITSKAGASGKLFGSVNNATIAEELAKQGIDVDKKYLKVPGGNIKRVGKYTINVRLHRGVEAELNVEIIGDVEKSELASKNATKEAVEAKKVASEDTFNQKVSIDDVVNQTKPKSVQEKEKELAKQESAAAKATEAKTEVASSDEQNAGEE